MNERGEGNAAQKPEQSAPAPRRKKQAVVLIHGMGEQIPMETLRGFVETMWIEDETLHSGAKGGEIFFKPDARNDSTELWRITTRAIHPRSDPGRIADGKDQRVDFYELYWADLTASNTLEQLKEWVLFLLLRRPKQVPDAVKNIWIVLWIIAAVLAFLLAWKALAAASFICPAPDWVIKALAVVALVYGLLIKLVISYLGDVARYCRAAPQNIAARRAIRERGVSRLGAIAESDDYDRIIIVAHSLGSVIAYDLLKLLWADWAAHTSLDDGGPLVRALTACEAAGEALRAAPDDTRRAAFRKAQADVFAAAAHDPRSGRTEEDPRYRPWRISDFVTVGAALTHAQFLMAHDEQEFERGREERRFPTIPPKPEDGATGRKGYLYDDRRADPDNPPLRINHAAGFAAVRWTNIHDQPRPALFGDLVSGPVAPVFGEGALDVKVEIRRTSWARFFIGARTFTHNWYWRDHLKKKGSPPPQVEALRKALNLARWAPRPPL